MFSKNKGLAKTNSKELLLNKSGVNSGGKGTEREESMAVMEAKRTHQNVEDYYDLAIYGVIFSIIGARAYYVIFSWDMYKDDIKSIINIREGGLAIYGGVITAIVVVFIFAKIKGLSPFLLFDTGGFGLITGQMIGRWGNFFNSVMDSVI